MRIAAANSSHAMEGEVRMETTDGGNRPAGANGSRTNALQHGLTATKYLPKILRPGRLAELVASLQAEYRPRTVTEELLVREAARHAAALEITEVAEPAVMRTAAQALAQLASSEHTADAEDLQLAAAITTEPLDRAARYRRGHEKDLHQALERLRNLQTASGAPQPSPAADCTTQFTTLAGCETYLRQRFLSRGWRCPRCQRPRGHWLDTRQRWECADCGAQIGLRQGTVFEHSRLPLTSWFLAIRAFAGHTSITVRELMQLTGIKRPATVQSMLERIGRAIDENNLTPGLAGLTNYPLECAMSRSPNGGISETKNSPLSGKDAVQVLIRPQLPHSP